jgi:hypothetical protein
MTERIAVGLFITLAAAFIVALFTLTGCVKAKGVEQTSGRDSKSGVIETKATVSTTTSQPVTVTATSNAKPVTEIQTPTGQHTNTGGFILQYAPVIATGGGIGVLLAWLGYSWRVAKLNRDGEIKIAELDLERDRLTIETLAKMRDCHADRPPCEKKE